MGKIWLPTKSMNWEFPLMNKRLVFAVKNNALHKNSPDSCKFVYAIGRLAFVRSRIRHASAGLAGAKPRPVQSRRRREPAYI